SAVQTFTITVSPVADAPGVTNATTSEDTQTTTGLVIIPSPVDGPEVTVFQITGITGGSLFQSDGVTAIHNGDFITVAEGAAGLRFTPGADLNTPAGGTFGFLVRAAIDANGTGISPAVAATITVTAVNDAPSFTKGADVTVLEDSGAYN